MTIRLRLSYGLLAGMMLWAAACASEPEPAQPNEGLPSSQAPTDAPEDLGLVFDTTGRIVSVTHPATGNTFVLFEDETFEDSEEGTFHQLLSSFGDYVSYRAEWYYEGGAHPSYGQQYRAVIVHDSLAEADLRNLFPEAEIYTALQATPLVQDTPLAHATLEGLLDGLAEAYPCTMDFTRFYSSFFVHSIERNTAVVVVGLTHGCEVERGTFTTLRLRIPVSDQGIRMFDDLRLFHQDTDN